MSIPVDIAFGPVPSRRLGRSLGINNIPPKRCSNSCVYCQLGPTLAQEVGPGPFYPPGEICRQVALRVEAVQGNGQDIDYLTFVPDGEPTLDAGLAAAIEGLRPLGIPIAVISNASLIWRQEVRAALGMADWVSLKVDSVDESTWRRINRPHPELVLLAAQIRLNLAENPPVWHSSKRDTAALTAMPDGIAPTPRQGCAAYSAPNWTVIPPQTGQ